MPLYRKYLTAAKLEAFLQAAEEVEDRAVRTFCCTLAYTRGRISDALALTADRVDLKEGTLIFESLKKRRRGLYRAIPAPPALLRTLELVHDLRVVQKRRDGGKRLLLWTWAATPPGGMWARRCEGPESPGRTPRPKDSGMVLA